MKRSRVSTEPVTWGLVSLEHLLSEFLVSTVLNSVHFKSMGVAIDEMLLGEHVGNWVESSDNGKSEAEQQLGVWDLSTSNVHKVFGNIMSHLWGR